MIDINSESLIPFRDIPAWTKEHLGNRVHPSTIHRWRLRGARGIKLETILAGGTRYSSHEALCRFFATVTAAADGESHIAIQSALDSKAIEKAEAYLEQEGV